MAYRYTDVNTRLAYSTSLGTVGQAGKIVKFWANSDGTGAIDVGLYSEAAPSTPGTSTGSNQLTVQSDSMWPAMWDRTGAQDHMWIQIGTASSPGTLYKVYADADQRLDALDAAGLVANVKSPTYGAVGNGVADDTAAIQAAINAAITAGSAVSTTREGILPVYLPRGTYKITAPLTVTSVQGFQLTGAGFGSQIVVSGNLDYALRLNGVATSRFADFTIKGKTASDSVTTALAHDWIPASAARSATQNHFRNIYIADLKYVNGFGFGLESSVYQLDQVTVEKCVAIGEWTDGENTWWQNGFVSGSGVHANPLNHQYWGCSANANRYNVFVNVCNTMWYGGALGYAEADFRQLGTMPISIKGSRSETSSRLLVQGGGAAYLSMVSMEDVRFVTNALDDDGRVIVMGYPGSLNISNLCLTENSATPATIYFSSAQSRTLNVSIRGAQARTPVGSLVQSNSATVAPLNVVIEGYTETDAGGAPVEVTPAWFSGPVTVATPTASGHATTKAYVASQVSAPPDPVLLAHKTLASGDEPGAFVAWTADDGYATFVDYFALLTSKGINGTLFLTKNWVDQVGTNPTWNDGYITQAQVAAIIAAGHEVGSHGVDHENHLAYQQANGSSGLHTLVREGIDYIEQTYDVTVRTGAYPYGLSDPVVREVMARSHDFYRGTKGVVAFKGQDPFDVHSIDIQALDEATIKAKVDLAVADRALCVFLVHGGLTADHITKFGNVIDYCTGLGVRQGTFYQGMTERVKLRGAAGFSLDTAGHVFAASVRSQHLEVARSDALADKYWLDIDEVTNRPQFDASSASTWEFNQPTRMVNSFSAGERNVFVDGVTTDGSTAIASNSAGFYARDVGRTISGTGIPVGTTIVSVTNGINAVMSQQATATATGVTITIGRPSTGIATFAKQADFFGTTNIRSTGTPTLNFTNMLGTASGSISHTTWGRAGNGGAMLIDSGTGGSYVTWKGYAVKLLKHDDSLTLTLMPRNGSPEASNAEPVGSLTMRADGTPALGVLHVKETGAATNTGWSAVLTRTGLYVTEGSNARQGVATLVGGTVTVANTSVTASSRIFLTLQSLGTVTAPKSIAVTGRSVGTSFTITSADATDTSVVAYQICEPG